LRKGAFDEHLVALEADRDGDTGVDLAGKVAIGLSPVFQVVTRDVSAPDVDFLGRRRMASWQSLASIGQGLEVLASGVHEL
jgi:hypothetical protein